MKLCRVRPNNLTAYILSTSSMIEWDHQLRTASLQLAAIVVWILTTIPTHMNSRSPTAICYLPSIIISCSFTGKSNSTSLGTYIALPCLCDLTPNKWIFLKRKSQYKCQWYSKISKCLQVLLWEQSISNALFWPYSFACLRALTPVHHVVNDMVEDHYQVSG